MTDEEKNSVRECVGAGRRRNDLASWLNRLRGMDLNPVQADVIIDLVRSRVRLP